MADLSKGFSEQFSPFNQRMQQEGLPDIAIKTFAYYYQQLQEGQTGLIAESDLKRVETLPDSEAFSAELATIGELALPKAVLLKLNGGLGTSMGLHQAKSLLTVKDGLNFLDIIAKQAIQTSIPLVLMNSFATRADSLAALQKYPELNLDMPLDFVQHKVLKVNQADFAPARWPQEPTLEWCPPGHGDLYTALVTSGLLDRLLERGYIYAFVSNADNLGAVMDTAILGYFAQNQAPFMMEVADRTQADRKGGHLAQLLNGRLVLRELAQTPAEDRSDFQDISRHKYFNTNNLWLNLPALKETLAAHNYILGLPMIRNAKTVDPSDPNSTPVYQLETAMGSAISVFKRALAIRVSRARFAPVKTTDDLLAIRSDAYVMTDDFHIKKNPARTQGQIVIDLDSHYYKLIDHMEARFPEGAPSLVDCERLTISGDIRFGQNVTLKGTVNLINDTDQQTKIAAHSIIKGK